MEYSHEGCSPWINSRTTTVQHLDLPKIPPWMTLPCVSDHDPATVSLKLSEDLARILEC